MKKVVKMFVSRVLSKGWNCWYTGICHYVYNAKSSQKVKNWLLNLKILKVFYPNLVVAIIKFCCFLCFPKKVAVCSYKSKKIGCSYKKLQLWACVLYVVIQCMFCCVKFVLFDELDICWSRNSMDHEKMIKMIKMR